MSGFLEPPTFLPAQYLIPWKGLPSGYTLQILASGKLGFAAAGGSGGGGVGSYVLEATTTGVYNDFALAAGVGRIDFDTTSGNIELTGIDATNAVDAQLLIVRNIGANNVILDSENTGSLAANRMQLPGQMFLPKFDAFLLCRYTAVNRWAMAG